MKQTLMITNVRIVCECGGELNAEIKEYNFTVTPCPLCLERQHKKGYDQGYLDCSINNPHPTLKG